MFFLISKILILLLLAALLGAWFGRWWLRRSFVDVTTEHSRLEEAWRGWRQGFEDRLAQRPAVDWTPLTERLDAVEALVRAIRIPQPVATDLGPVLAAVGSIRMPREVDLQPLQSRLATLERAVSSIRMPDVPPPPDLGPLQQQLSELDRAVRAIRIPPPPAATDLSPVLSAVGAIRIHAPKDVDLEQLQSRLAALERAVAGIRLPELPPPADLAPMQRQLAELDKAVRGIRIPEPAMLDLAPVQSGLARVEQSVKSIALPSPEKVDLGEVTAQLRAIEHSVQAIRIPAPQAAADLAPMQRRLDAIELALRAITIPPVQKVDLDPVLNKLAALEARVARPEPTPAPAPATPPATTPAVRNPAIRSGSRNLLARPAYGTPDDLKRIKGVAQVLEKMLHRIGVYYFWQIAEWTAYDVAQANDQLPSFKGRIARDDWVRQAGALARAPGASSRPAEL